MDISLMSIKQVEQLQYELELRKNELKEQELNEKRNIVKQKINKFIEHRDIILSLIDHGRTSCSDDNVSNGYNSLDGYARCNKCHLIEVFDYYCDTGEFDIIFNVTINRVE